MATVYKTPGVFVEEIPKLPPSVAQVETAIPAFVGITELAYNPALGDLNKKPVRIGSLVEFELYFGGGPSPVVGRVDLDSSNNFVSATVTSQFYLYDSVRLFYANGGGDCYIVSVALYPTVVTASLLTSGIETLEKEDEPTILLFPDAVTLGEDALATVQVAALTQCNNMQDRVAVFDLRQADPKGASFRNKIGINYLKYGAAYTPWLKVNLPKAVKYPDVKSVVYRAGVLVPSLSALTTDAQVLDLLGKVDQAYTDRKFVTDQTDGLTPDASDLLGQWDKLYGDFRATNNDGNLLALFNLTYNIAGKVNTYAYGTAPNALTLPDYKGVVTGNVASTFDPILAQVVTLNKEADSDIASYTAADITTIVTIANWNQTNTANGAAVPTPGAIDLGTDEERRIAAVNLLKPLFLQLNLAYQSVVLGSAASYTKTLEDSLVLSFPVYKTIVTGTANSMSSIPPSGAVAGVYAATDRTRGVWKAPANVSLANVIGPDTTFTAAELDALNVDAVSGKSINAIRAFTGKGTLIFGARTLAGNDNEWRYISVRRFFNMVEESTKKATEPFVFEPNDANTWVRVQGMIENFLTTLWRQGALQGAKPEHAFYVAVGLGKTMTALDILEGRMIIEIGMAVVRPAEFIILRFSHKMAES
jgi:phage tail sheath protein FI